MSRTVRVCSATELGRADVRVVSLARTLAGRPREAIVLRDHDGVLRAYLNECQHLPIPLDAGSREFLTDNHMHLQCSTHGALYTLEDGLCILGPCEGDSLVPLPVFEGANGEVLLLDED